MSNNSANGRNQVDKGATLLEKLISKFNTAETHIEIDTINQFENGTTTDINVYTYTIYLINNADGEPITQESVDTFAFAETEMTYWNFINALKKIIQVTTTIKEEF